MMGALALSLGIAIQNFPEGAIISMPLKARERREEMRFSTVCFPAPWNRWARL